MKKSVLVTGSAKRIGRRLALDLAKDGWDVAVHCNASLAEAEEVDQGFDWAEEEEEAVDVEAL